MSDQVDKKFANMHYPGMKADPNEGKAPIGTTARWRFEAQTAFLGEDAQRRLLNASVLVLTTTPLGARVAKKLFEMGIGRVGMYGDAPVTGAHDVAAEAGHGVLAALARWSKVEAPWAEFEPFGSISIDRQLEDIVRGFQALVGDAENARDVIRLARSFGLPAVIMFAGAKSAWFMTIPKGSLCEDCLVLPATIVEPGFYYPILDAAGSRISNSLIDITLGCESGVAMLDTFDERLEQKPRADCKNCG